MEKFETEEQQVEAIKEFWNKNGNSIIAGIVIGLGGFIGFNLYKDSKLEAEMATTDSYITLMESSQSAPDAFGDKAEAFITENADSSLASLAAFALAKEAVNKEDWAAAEKHLTTAAEKATTDAIKAIANLRLARVQVQAEKLDAALITLAKPFPESFKSNVAEVKGDAYLLQGNKDKARMSYQTAIDNKAAGVPSMELQMKLDNLAEVTNLAG